MLVQIEVLDLQINPGYLQIECGFAKRVEICVKDRGVLQIDFGLVQIEVLDLQIECGSTKRVEICVKGPGLSANSLWVCANRST